jgi:hypothetical protein
MPFNKCANLNEIRCEIVVFSVGLVLQENFRQSYKSFSICPIDFADSSPEIGVLIVPPMVSEVRAAIE